MIFNNGDKYEGDFKNDLAEEKEFIIIKMVIDMKVILLMEKEKEKEFIIIKMVIDMKVIIKMIILMEKELCIIIMVIE